MELTPEALRLFNARYALKNARGEPVETPEAAAWRLARAAALAERPKERSYWADRFFGIIAAKDFLPSTPIWANVGKPGRPWQPAACFVLGVEDSLEGMYETLKQTALVSKWGGGVGFNFSAIRPAGDAVSSTQGRASGVVELLKLYNASAAMVRQGGVRRGAFMGVLNADHPEIFEFVRAKREGGLENFNLSVGVSDAFMEAVLGDGEWELAFRGRVRRRIRARLLWQEIVAAAWACGDPGLLFLDRLRETNPVPKNPLEATNPCGEQPLSPGESCLLGSLNLARMVRPGDGAWQVAWDKLAETAQVALRFLDDLIDVGAYPLPFIAERTRATRKVGLGVLGLHDLLIRLGLPYDSPEGRRAAREVLRAVREAAFRCSANLAAEKGCFPEWRDSVFWPGTPRRNASCITIAPTGTITIIAGTESYGIEPIFALAYKKVTEEGTLEFFSRLFEEACAARGVPAAALAAVREKGSCQGVAGVPGDIQRLFKGAYEIKPEDHLAMLVELQQEVDNAISKTVNLPPEATPADVEAVFREAYRGRLKGITVFRAGSKEGVVTLGTRAACPLPAPPGGPRPCPECGRPF